MTAPAFDIDNETRPQNCVVDIGADEALGTPCAQADLSITKTDGVSSVSPGGNVNYTIVVANAGPSAVTGAPVSDILPAALTVNSWTCSAPVGSSCTATGSGNNRGGTVTLPSGGSATFIANTTLAVSASGTLANTATVTVPANVAEINPANNSATDTDTITAALNKHIGDLDGTASGGVIFWGAAVQIAVHNSGHNPVNGATVTGTWSGGFGGTSTCQTNSSGLCSVSRIGFGGTSLTFTVTNVTGANSSGPYTAANNHDPDGDSNGTAITVQRP